MNSLLYSKGDLIGDFNLFFAGHYASWSEESVQKLKEFISNGGNVIFGSGDDWRLETSWSTTREREPMRK